MSIAPAKLDRPNSRLLQIPRTGDSRLYVIADGSLGPEKHQSAHDMRQRLN
jgi:hypothetical protein